MRCVGGIRAGFLVLVGVGLSACAADGTLLLPKTESRGYPPPGYVHRVASSHVELYWNCTRPEPGLLRLEGVAVNPWSEQPVRYLEFELAGVAAGDRIVSEAKAEARDYQLYTNQSTPFQLDLKTTEAVIRIDLYYQYRFQEGDHGDRIVAGPMAGGPILLAQTQRFLARDVCSETQHLMR